MKRALPEVNFSDFGDVRYLHLGTEWVQGSMKLDAPFEIELEYVQRMMAWLLFADPAEVSKRHAMQLGLGAGSLTKFCRKARFMGGADAARSPRAMPPPCVRSSRTHAPRWRMAGDGPARPACACAAHA